MSRNLLAQHRLNEFANWIEARGIPVDRDPKGQYQKLGVRRLDGQWTYVYEQLDKTVHYTVDRRMEKLVRLFIEETK